MKQTGGGMDLCWLKHDKALWGSTQHKLGKYSTVQYLNVISQTGGTIHYRHAKEHTIACPNFTEILQTKRGWSDLKVTYASFTVVLFLNYSAVPMASHKRSKFPKRAWAKGPRNLTKKMQMSHLTEKMQLCWKMNLKFLHSVPLKCLIEKQLWCLQHPHLLLLAWEQVLVVE